MFQADAAKNEQSTSTSLITSSAESSFLSLSRFKHLTQFQKQLISSGCSSVLTTLVVNPLVVVKVRVQYNPLNTVESVVSNIVKTDGIRGFWVGANTALFLSVPSVVMYMITYENIKSNLYDRTRSDSNSAMRSFIPLLAGAIARFVSVSLTAPIERIRTIQSSGTSVGSFVFIGSSLIRDEGFTGLYKGWMGMIMRDVPFSALYWSSYETLRHIIAPSSSNKKSDIISPITALFIGGISGATAALVTHPFDVVKTTREVNVRKNPLNLLPASKQQAPDTFSTLRELYSEGGLRALYRGLGLRLFIVVPATAIMISSYEMVKSWL